MAYFLRRIRQSRWFVHPDIPWLVPGELQGDALLDLQTEGNSLSIWNISLGVDKDRVLTAIAANRENFSPLDYALFDDSLLTSIGLMIEPQVGDTPDLLVNSVHYDIKQLTIEKILSLANVLSKASHERLPAPKVRNAVRDAFQAGILDPNALKPEMLERLQ